MLLDTFPKEFFTKESMGTLLGAVSATFVICNGLQSAFNFNPRWLALAVALAISLFGVYDTTGNNPTDYFIGVVNGFLIFCTAAGGTEIISPKEKGKLKTGYSNSDQFGERSTEHTKIPKKRKFSSSWFR